MVEIKINGDSASPLLRELHRSLTELEESLIDLHKELVLSEHILTGQAYSTLLEVTETFVNEQKDILIQEKMIQNKIEAYITDMITMELRSKPKFRV